jgi:hypothetical protein
MVYQLGSALAKSISPSPWSPGTLFLNMVGALSLAAVPLLLPVGTGGLRSEPVVPGHPEGRASEDFAALPAGALLRGGAESCDGTSLRCGNPHPCNFPIFCITINLHHHQFGYHHQFASPCRKEGRKRLHSRKVGRQGGKVMSDVSLWLPYHKLGLLKCVLSEIRVVEMCLITN